MHLNARVCACVHACTQAPMQGMHTHARACACVHACTCAQMYTGACKDQEGSACKSKYEPTVRAALTNNDKNKVCSRCKALLAVHGRSCMHANMHARCTARNSCTVCMRACKRHMHTLHVLTARRHTRMYTNAHNIHYSSLVNISLFRLFFKDCLLGTICGHTISRTHACTHMHTRIHARTRMCMRVRMRANTHTHTHAHPCTHP